MQRILGLLGRLCFSVIFIVSGVAKIMSWDATEQMLVNQMLDLLSKFHEHPIAQSIFNYVVPLAPTLLVVATIIELVCGLLILLGIQVRIGALILFLYLIPVTYLFHNFWALEGSAQQLQLTMFLKNLSIFGGLFFILAFGTGDKKGSKPKKFKE